VKRDHLPDSFQAVYPACIALHVLELVFTPPAHLPDIFPVLNVLACTPVFVLTWLWSIKRGFEVQWALGGLSSQSSATTNGTQTSSSNHSITL
jgi:alpha-1,3-glucosyltransferase